MLELSSLPPRLREFHALWDRKRGSRALPARPDFAFEELRPWLGQLHVVEVLPTDFRFKVFAGKSAARMRQELTGKLISEITPAWMAEDATKDYREVVDKCIPLYADRTRREHEGRVYSWRRLILPLGQGEAVDHLFVCMDYDFI
jgi:hypothetical protein